MNKNFKIALLIGVPILVIVFIVVLLVSGGDDTATTEDNSDTASDDNNGSESVTDNDNQSSSVTDSDTANNEATEGDSIPTDVTPTDDRNAQRSADLDEVKIAVRNAQRQSDIANLRAEFSVFVANNTGNLPTDDMEFGQFHDLATHGYIVFGHYADSAGNISATNVLDETAVGKNRIIYTKNTGPMIGATLYPGVDEIHVWGGRGCGENTDGVLSGGNPSSGETNKYAAADIVPASPRAVAFVYQLEGEPTARCEDDL